MHISSRIIPHHAAAAIGAALECDANSTFVYRGDLLRLLGHLGVGRLRWRTRLQLVVVLEVEVSNCR